ncbi:uncharacterized protein SPSK_00168 [Sporothrix schenckii 1099-18]|uniref:Alpha-L-rhamnosidase six-hairpin glycosidase domain-containing protein n=1 Tax=Sporothrix schenckii 1099-18 TaxID=1397361 RepID=A0A0F2M1X8_SPOSC|nr:uncharacterized protein SPSK_00168 [Sporothrix schenckii 1099-18]KJR83718.1 hypothetical protein SPSK_00168 [Sporothrix schenckii 1099-18]
MRHAERRAAAGHLRRRDPPPPPSPVVSNILQTLWPHLPLAVWDDVAVLTPWDRYRAFGDVAFLSRQYESMVAWIDRGVPRGADGLWLSTQPPAWRLARPDHTARQAPGHALQRRPCGWCAPCARQGATTIWGRWDNILSDGSIDPGVTTSFNQDSLGLRHPLAARERRRCALRASWLAHLCRQPHPGRHHFESTWSNLTAWPPAPIRGQFDSDDGRTRLRRAEEARKANNIGFAARIARIIRRE